MQTGDSCKKESLYTIGKREYRNRRMCFLRNAFLGYVKIKKKLNISISLKRAYYFDGSCWSNFLAIL